MASIGNASAGSETTGENITELQNNELGWFEFIKENSYCFKVWCKSKLVIEFRHITCVHVQYLSWQSLQKNYVDRYLKML